MKRRDFLKKAGLASVGVGVTAGCAPQSGGGPAVQSRPRVRWRLVSSFPRGLDTIYGAAELLAERVSKLTEGRFEILCYPSGELVPGLQVLDAVQQGTVQCGHTASYYYTGKSESLAFDTAQPFGLTARQQNAWLYHGGGLELLREVLADFNIINFPGGNTGAQMGGWFRREIPTLTDLNGLKMRIPGLGGRVMAELGVTVQTLAGGEIYPALERGAIDATEWVGPYDDEKLGFHKVANYYYYPGWWEPGPGLSIYVHRESWDQLPQEYRDILEVAAYESNVSMQSRYDALNPAAILRLKAGGTLLRRFSNDIMEAARNATRDLQEQLAAGDPTYRKIFDSWRQFRDDSYAWFGSCELAYANFAFPKDG